MGCANSVCRIRSKRSKKKIPEVSIFVPPLRVPVQSDDIQKGLGGVVSKDLVNRLSSLRNQIGLVAEDTGGSAIPELQRALEEYLSLIVGLTHREFGLQELVEFKWRNLEDGRHEICVANSWFELLSVVHMMAMLTLMESNSMLVRSQTSSSETVVTTGNLSHAVDLLVKAAGYLEFSLREILEHIPPEIMLRLPADLLEGMLQATFGQALGQGTELQLSLAIESRNATLPVKRRLACEQLSYFGQAHYCLSTSNNINEHGKKHMLFIKWKYLEAKAAAYYFHGLITDKGTEPSCHISAVCCFLAAEELLVESKKACLSFCLAVPVTRAPPPWGAMKYLTKKIPETAARKSDMYGYFLQQEKGLENLPELPEFELSLKPDNYELPRMDSAWDNGRWMIPGQTLKVHLKDSEEEMESK